MRISRIIIQNFRGVQFAALLFPQHGVLIGDNNTGKSTVLEAIDLAMGPDRLARRPPVNEHDFFRGKYLAPQKPDAQPAEQSKDQATGKPPAPTELSEALEGEEIYSADEVEADETALPQITVEVLVTHLSEEQQSRFGSYLEWWDTEELKRYTEANPAGVDQAHIVAAMRVTFVGEYDEELDDFTGETYFTRSMTEDEKPMRFGSKDKQYCGFLYLRSVRTGSRALSLERGSLLDIILRLKEIRPKMWEETITHLAGYDVAGDPKLGLSGILESVSASLKKYVPKEWGAAPHLKVSLLTREHLRQVISAFIATGDDGHAAPFFRQGNGTVNMLVLALLSQIAADKQNVVFAMEEPETAIPPYAQKRIVHEIRKLAAQSLFTSHSPYVLEEFKLDETVVLSRDENGYLKQTKIALPDSVKHKRYRQEFRTRFCEGLLARRLLLAEGATEATAIPAVARRLSELAPTKFSSLEALGVCTVDVGTDSQVEALGKFYRSLGKTVYGLCDKQSDATKQKIVAAVDELFMHEEKGFEDLVLNNTSQAALERFCEEVDWPPHLQAKYPDPKTNAKAAMQDLFAHTKGNWGLADFLAQCEEAEVPQWIKDTCARLKVLCEPPPATPPSAAGGAVPSV